MDVKNVRHGIAVEMQDKKGTSAQKTRSLTLKFETEGLDELEARIDQVQAKALTLEVTLKHVANLLEFVAPGRRQQTDAHDIAKKLAEEAVTSLNASLE